MANVGGSAASISGFSVSTLPGFYTTYTPGQPNTFPAPLFPTLFYLSDGTSTGGQGAGSYLTGHFSIGQAVASGNALAFQLLPTGLAVDGPPFTANDTHVAIAFQDFYSSPLLPVVEAGFDYASPLTLTTTVGSNTAIVSGYLEYLGRFYYSADGDRGSAPFTQAVGGLVPFSMNFVLTTGTWNANTFSQTFSYSVNGMVGTIAPEPASFGLFLWGLPIILMIRTVARRLVGGV